MKWKENKGKKKKFINYFYRETNPHIIPQNFFFFYLKIDAFSSYEYSKKSNTICIMPSDYGFRLLK